MKKIKSFVLFEAAVKGVRLEDDIEGMWELFDDIKLSDLINSTLLIVLILFKVQLHIEIFFVK